MTRPAVPPAAGAARRVRTASIFRPHRPGLGGLAKKSGTKRASKLRSSAAPALKSRGSKARTWHSVPNRHSPPKMPPPMLRLPSLVVVLLMLRIQGFGSRAFNDHALTRPATHSPRGRGRRPGRTRDIRQRRRKIQNAKSHQSADKQSKQRQSAADGCFTCHSYTIHVRCSTVINGQMLRPWRRIGARERSTMQVPDGSPAPTAISTR